LPTLLAAASIRVGQWLHQSIVSFVVVRLLTIVFHLDSRLAGKKYDGDSLWRPRCYLSSANMVALMARETRRWMLVRHQHGRRAPMLQDPVTMHDLGGALLTQRCKA
jgi:hypothetical protein